MKKAWYIASTTSFLILLAGGMIIIWWWSNGRLDSDRVSSMYSILMSADPIADEVENARPLTEESGVLGSSSRRLVMRGDETRRLAVDYQVLQHQATARQSQIDMALKSLAEAREALAVERAAFEMAKETAQAPVAGRDPDTQFHRSIDLIEAAQPAQAKIWILSMTEQGRFEDAVAALDAMQPRSASRILREFQSAAEMELAGKLLEALGRYGTDSWPIPSKELSEGVSRGKQSSPTR
tara:strand:- start:757 stop:1473 length:717 start_codon:yes stop_codon:yes gene_type:complete